MDTILHYIIWWSIISSSITLLLFVFVYLAFLMFWKIIGWSVYQIVGVPITKIIRKCIPKKWLD